MNEKIIAFLFGTVFGGIVSPMVIIGGMYVIYLVRKN